MCNWPVKTTKQLTPYFPPLVVFCFSLATFGQSFLSKADIDKQFKAHPWIYPPFLVVTCRVKGQLTKCEIAQRECLWSSTSLEGIQQEYKRRQWVLRYQKGVSPTPLVILGNGPFYVFGGPLGVWWQIVSEVPPSRPHCCQRMTNAHRWSFNSLEIYWIKI